MDVKQALEWAEDQFVTANLWFGHGTDNAWDEAVVLLSATGVITPESDVSVLENVLSHSEWSEFETLVQRRICERIPASYLIGKGWFAGLEFIVDERVLVPRSPIAELIQNEFQPWVLHEPERVLDLCCGSGCIGIATALTFPQAQITLSDLSIEALQVAQANVQKFELQERCLLVCSDLFSGFQGQKFDLIVSNPPYVDARDIAELPEEYRHEPEMGLASGEDGLDLTRRILAEALDYLTPEGLLIVEVGNSWVALEEAFPTLPFCWIEFANGGDGVFVLTAEELKHYRMQQSDFHTV